MAGKNTKVLAKINQIIQDIMRNGNDGIGQSEHLNMISQDYGAGE